MGFPAETLPLAAPSYALPFAARSAWGAAECDRDVFMGSPFPRTLRSIASRLTRRLREERLNDFIQVGTLAFRAVHLLRLVLLDGQHFAKFVMALTADVFVKGRRLLRLLIEGSVSF
jgi:hypothetical protein